MKRARRIIFKSLLFLLAGAIVNVGVAWACSIWSTARYDEQSLQRGDSFELHLDNFRNGIKVRLHRGEWVWAEARVIGATWRQMGRDANGEPVDCSQQHLAGFPVRSVYCIGTVRLPPKLVDAEFISAIDWEGGFNCPSVLEPQLTPYFVLPSVERPLPFTPLVLGFAINTVFYAAILWLLFVAPFILRRRRRIKRGLCPACGDDLRGSADSQTCAECGERQRFHKVS